MAQTIFLLALGLFSSLVLGQDFGCMSGIRTALAPFYFSGGQVFDYYQNLCTNELRVTSIYAAAKVYCTEKEIEVGVSLLEDNCFTWGDVEAIPWSEIEPKLTDEYIASLPTLTFEDRAAGGVLSEPYLIDEDYYQLALRAAIVPNRQFSLHMKYGWGVYGFWGGLIFIGMASRFIFFVSRSRLRRPAADIEGEGVTRKSGLLSPFKAVHHWFRTNLIIPAAFGSHHQRLYYWCAIPTRMETLIVVMYWGLNIILCAISYEVLHKMSSWGRPSIQLWKHISDRTGIISYANLPWLWLFSGRNNIFIWATGWSYSSYSIYHRHIARVATIQAVIHSIAWSVMEADAGSLGRSWGEHYWYMGGIATITMSLLMGLSSVYLRMRHYEVFLIIHIVFAVLTLVGLWYHTVDIGQGLLVRFVRLAYCNYRVRYSGTAPLSTTTIATYSKDTDMIRIEAVVGPNLLRPGPGQHYFLYQYNRLLFWENHPFTLAAWYGSNDSGSSKSIISSETESAPEKTAATTAVVEGTENPTPLEGTPAAVVTEVTDNSQRDVISTASSSGSLSSPAEKNKPAPGETQVPIAAGQHKLVFLIRPFDGWTKRLRDQCIKAGPEGLNAKLLVEGPYGEKSPVLSFENIIFIVGGTGIAGAIPYLQEYDRLMASKSQKVLARDITVVWSAKQANIIRGVMDRELRPFLNRQDIHFKFYATRDNKTASSSSMIESEKLDTTRQTQIFDSRPDIRQSIFSVVEQVDGAGSRGGRIAIFTCGPAAMADEARLTAHEALKAGKQGLEYVEEAFGW
ncbi:hypothetical protein B0A52_07250 [Exophiala mesophila]|uniref:FAD-binding FR-type domain-containing protein n=1 Tax=Exophiala mesophila TaxID=212818 RepID=A0A438MWV9_EXOME|nr:hypothetical protein B0A52_07250 [Exophiala mesophila]